RTGSGLQEERQTLHVMDDQRRIALVETLTVTGGAVVPNPTSRQRYQLGDHLGTATLEFDEIGALIDYEECHPYGSTAWWATNSSTDVSAKRYRYTGKERDDETGLGYHGARYFAAWLGRWERVDPAGMVDGPNRYAYFRGSPIRNADPTGQATTADLLNSTAPLAYTPEMYEQMPALRQQLQGTAVRQHAQEVDAHPVKAAAVALAEGMVGAMRSDVATPMERGVHGVGMVVSGETAGPLFDSIAQGEVTPEAQEAVSRVLAWSVVGGALARGGGLALELAAKSRVGRFVGGQIDEVVGLGPDFLRGLGDDIAKDVDAMVPRSSGNVVTSGQFDQAHEVFQARRLGVIEGGGEFRGLGNSSQGIEGYFIPEGGGPKIPVSLKDFTETGRLSNVIGRINVNAAQIRAAGHTGGDVVLHARVSASPDELERFVRGGPLANMAGEGTFSRLIFDAGDAVIEVSRQGVFRR
ncbi:MAG: RHS repeat-associated core domain-containing protein, partial [Myxococcota bacterium]